MGVPCTHSDVGAGDAGRAGFRKQESSYRGCMACAEGDHAGEGVTDEAGKTGLSGGIADRSSRSRAISAPASRVLPVTRPSACGSAAWAGEGRGWNRPRRALCW